MTSRLLKVSVWAVNLAVVALEIVMMLTPEMTSSFTTLVSNWSPAAAVTYCPATMPVVEAEVISTAVGGAGGEARGVHGEEREGVWVGGWVGEGVGGWVI